MNPRYPLNGVPVGELTDADFAAMIADDIFDDVIEDDDEPDEDSE
jgi:hypothetical protein